MRPTDAATSGPGTVRVLAATGPSGRGVFEEIPARPIGPGRWRLEASPGLALGAAAGDEIVVRPDGAFEVVTRSGNVAVHVTGPGGDAARRDELTASFERLGGRLDGRSWTKDGASVLSVYTAPVQAGFAAIEAACDAYASAVPGANWYFVNVYDPADEVTPLNWWEDERFA